MLPIFLKLFEEESIFDEDGGEKPISLDTIFDNQTFLYFCVLQGKDKVKNWYRLYNDKEKKEGERFAELNFIYSKKEGFEVNSSDGDLTSIKDIKKHFTELNDKTKDWEILGIKKDCASKDVINTACWAQKRIFSSEKDLHYIFHNATDRLEKEIVNIGSVEVTLDFSKIDIYLDDDIDIKGSAACTITYQPISSRSGEHKVVLKKGSHEIGSSKIQINPEKITKVSIPIKGTGNDPSKVTFSLLVLLAIMAAIDIVWSPSPLFIFYLISFIGVFYKTKWGSGLSIFSGFIAFILSDPTFMYLLGILLMALGWKEYSVLKKS